MFGGIRCLFQLMHDFFDFDNSKELSDVKLVKYKHMGKIPMPIAQ